jgi:hypothetical protein
MKEVLTLKEVMENKDLAKFIAEDLDEIPEDAEVTYELWAIGYNADGAVTDTEMFIAEFKDPDAAIEFAKKVTMADIVHQAAEEHDGSTPAENVTYISLEVETVVDEDEDGTMNIGTIYKRELWIDGEYGDEEDAPEDEYSEVVPVTAKDYRLLEDGSLEIDCDILKNFNKNDMVQIWFTDEDHKSILTYKIISKTTGNKFICEFIY